MKRKLFCEISPFAYDLSIKKERLKRYLKNFFAGPKFAKTKSSPLPFAIFKYDSLIRRTMENMSMELQDNKAVNLGLAAPKVSGILIKPGEVFSLWQLVGICTVAKGYREGLMISCGKAGQGVGGGMCHFADLLHWMVVHTPLDVVEMHHHNHIDLFPDYGWPISFGLGTSIFYNYLDFRVKNNTDNTFQIVVHTSATHLCGEIRAAAPLSYSYQIVEEDKHFVCLDGEYYRRNKVYRDKIDNSSGEVIARELMVESDAAVQYDSKFIPKELLRTT